MSHGGVGFVIRSDFLKTMKSTPCGISPRLIKAEINLEDGHTATLFSCYAPTLAASQEDKGLFYEQLSYAMETVPYKHKLFVLGDFNARVRRETTRSGVK